MNINKNYVDLSNPNTSKNSLTQLDMAYKSTDLAYKLKSPSKYVLKEQDIISKDFAETDWEMLCKSSDKTETNQHGYKAVAFVNSITKEVHIATAGTVPTNMSDLMDDFLLVSRKVPYKIEPAKNMVTQVIELLGGEELAKEYNFSTSGHSLGAVISDLTAVDIYSRGYKVNKSITFDSPGSLPIVEKAIRDNLFTQKVELSTAELTEYSEVYNTKPNFINQTGRHLGKVNLTLTSPSEDSQIVSTNYSSSKWGFGAYLCNKVGSAVKSCAEYLGITNVLNEIENHSLKTFRSMEAEAKIILTDNWQKIDNKQLVIKDVPGLSKVTSTGKDVVVIDQSEDDDGFIHCGIRAYGYNDVLRADDGSNDSVEMIGEYNLIENYF